MAPPFRSPIWRTNYPSTCRNWIVAQHAESYANLDANNDSADCCYGIGTEVASPRAMKFHHRFEFTYTHIGSKTFFGAVQKDVS
jgi:hypothetical protein